MTNGKVIARFSPGPWWGFNGVDHLELDEDSLTRKHYLASTGFVPMRYMLRDVRVISAKERKGLLQRSKTWTTLVLSLDGERRLFTGHTGEVAAFVKALQEASAN
jgi:hypothetical protein